MPVKASRVADSASPPEKTGESTGISILFVPDVTYRLLSDEAAARNMTVAQFLAAAVSAYIGGEVPSPEEIPTPAPKRVLTLKGYK